METMSASSYQPRTPQTQLSHMRETRPRPPIGSTQQATRTMQAASSQQQQLSAPASQESMLSVDSYGSSTGPRLQSSSSNLSQLTSYSDLTSPTTSAPGSQAQDAGKNRGIARVRTPEERNGPGSGMDALASPMSISTPMSVNGTKRTASGHVKQPSVSTTPLTSTLGGRRSRAESTSSAGSRAGELAANLKARLGYAMTKVQHGWEHKTFDEVEQLAAAEKAAKRHTMSHFDYAKRPVSAGLSNGTSRLSMYEANGDGIASPPSKRHSGSYAAHGQSYYQYQAGPRLQPAPDLRPTNGARGYNRVHPSQHSVASSAMSPPRTPNTHPRRPPVLRTDTQTAEAERDALQALFQLGSPHASQVSRQTNNASQASSSQASPLRAEFATPRRVTFARSESLGSSVGARPSSSEGSERQ